MADLLKKILEEWLSLVKRQVPASAGKSETFLSDLIKIYLDAVLRIWGGADDEILYEEALRKSKEHGELRSAEFF